MEKVKASYKVEGKEIFRSGVRIARVENETLVMEADCEKYEMVAKGMAVRMRLIPKKGEKHVKPKKAPSFVVETPEAEEESAEAAPEEAIVEAPPADMPVKAEVSYDKATDTVSIEVLRAQNAKAQAEIEVLKRQLAVAPAPVADNNAFIVAMSDPENPYGIPVLEIREDVPRCPELDYRGTKMPEAVAWLEKYYPSFAAKRLSKFYLKRRMLAEKERQKAIDEEREIQERAQFPRK